MKHIPTNRFADYQLACYITSCFSMILYFVHYAFGLSISDRISVHNVCEIALLLARGMNEYAHKKMDRNDIFHHMAFIVGSSIVLYVPACARFGFLLSHMQCLHFPMTVWYAGCKRRNAESSQIEQKKIRFDKICNFIFSPIWISCVSYRATIMLGSLCLSVRSLPSVIWALFSTLFVITTVIDLIWSKHFFRLLGLPSPFLVFLAGIAGCALGLAVLSTGAAL